MAKEPLKNHDNTEQMRTVLRASERVSSWPEWKRSTTLYRCVAAREHSEGRCAEERDQGASRNR
jgi:hypothetical protein